MISLEMRLSYPEMGIAEAVMVSLSPENQGFADVRLEGCDLVVSVYGENAATVRSTADDLLACVKAAEASLGIATGTDPGDDDD